MKKSVKKELKIILQKYRVRHPKDLYWEWVSLSSNLSEDFIIEFQNLIEWEYISYSSKLSEDFIREFQDKVHWKNICQFQTLSEDFIREFKNKNGMCWIGISQKQDLSYNFICEFREKLVLEQLRIRELITHEDIRKMYQPVNRFQLMDI